MSEPHTSAQVLATYGREYLVKPTDSKQALIIQANRKAGKAVCGDWVSVAQDDRLAAIQNRSSEYIRPDFRNRGKVIAANIDGIVWLTSHEPPNDPLIAARALLVSRLLKLTVTFVQSKADSAPDALPAHLTAAHSLAQRCNIPWLSTSVKQASGLAELQQALAGKLYLIVGQSGVGKSTLVAALTGDDSIRTQTVSASTGLGRHTTTTATLYQTDQNHLRLIDAPGMRDIGLWEMPEETFMSAFPELNQHSNQCRFSNCGHESEPGCAVIAALDAGDIPELLYQAYLHAKNKGLFS